MAETEHTPGEHRIPAGEAEAIAKVAEIAAETVVKKRRTKLVIATGLASAIVSLAIAIPVTILVTGQNSHVNCGLITELAGVEEEKAASEIPQTENFQKLSKDRFGLTQQKFDELTAATHEEQLHRLHVTRRVARHACA